MSKLRWLAGLCLVLGSVGIAVPQVALADAKYNRKTMDIKVQQTERTKKLEAKKVEKLVQPEITADV